MELGVIADATTPLAWVTLGIALAGLVLGIINSTVQVLAWRSNRARIRVQITTGLPVGIAGLNPRELHAIVTIRNIGQRPTTITSARLDLPRQSSGGVNVPLMDNPPAMRAELRKRLEEGEETTILISMMALRDIVSRGGMIRRVCVTAGGAEINRRWPRHLRGILRG
jgi:hypothetical protein